MSDKRIITPETLKQEQCQKELNALMQKYQVTLVPVFKFDGLGLNAGVKIMSVGDVNKARKAQGGTSE